MRRLLYFYHIYRIKIETFASELVCCALVDCGKVANFKINGSIGRKEK